MKRDRRLFGVEGESWIFGLRSLGILMIVMSQVSSMIQDFAVFKMGSKNFMTASLKLLMTIRFQAHFQRKEIHKLSKIFGFQRSECTLSRKGISCVGKIAKNSFYRE